MPVIGIIQVGTQARADRYTYLPMIGVYLMVAWLLKEVADRWPKTRIALAAASVVVLIVLSAVTFRQVSYWVDSYKLFEHAVQVTDRNYFAYNHIGIAYDSDAKKMTTMDANEAKELFDHLAKDFNRKSWRIVRGVPPRSCWTTCPRTSMGRPRTSTSRCGSCWPMPTRPRISGRRPGNSASCKSSSCCSTIRPTPSRRP